MSQYQTLTSNTMSNSEKFLTTLKNYSSKVSWKVFTLISLFTMGE